MHNNALFTPFATFRSRYETNLSPDMVRSIPLFSFLANIKILKLCFNIASGCTGFLIDLQLPSFEWSIAEEYHLDC